MTDGAPMPDAMTAPIGEIMSARASGAINEIAWSRTYSDAVSNRLLADSGMPTSSAVPQLRMSDIPIATSMPIDQEPAGTADPRLAAALEAAYALPSSAAEYSIPTTPDPSADDIEGIARAQNLLFASKLPLVTGNAVALAVDSAANSLRNADPSQRAAYEDGETAALQALWGEKYHLKAAMVGKFLRDTSSRVPELAQLLKNDRTRYQFAAREVWVAIDQWLSRLDQ